MQPHPLQLLHYNYAGFPNLLVQQRSSLVALKGARSHHAARDDQRARACGFEYIWLGNFVQVERGLKKIWLCQELIDKRPRACN